MRAHRLLLDAALGDDDRSKPSHILNSAQKTAIVALICGLAAESRARLAESKARGAHTP